MGYFRGDEERLAIMIKEDEMLSISVGPGLVSGKLANVFDFNR